MGVLRELAKKIGLPLVRYSGGASVPFEKQCVRCLVGGASQLTVTDERLRYWGNCLVFDLKPSCIKAYCLVDVVGVYLDVLIENHPITLSGSNIL